MRKFLSVVALLALAACGGGGAGGGSAPNPTNPVVTTPGATTPQSALVTPQFTLRIPARTSGSSRDPKYISSATASVVITLTADSAGIAPGSISGNPATTTIQAGTCNSGCTVNGPPTPPGTDSFTIVTYDNATPASGHALNAAQVNNVTIHAGQSNSQTATLGAIPASVSISGVPSGAGALSAGTQSQSATVSLAVTDAAGQTVPTSTSVAFVDATGAPVAITLSDPDTAAHGSCVVASGTSTCTTGSATAVTFSSSTDTRNLAYDGLAENPVTLTASAPNVSSGTAAFQPALHAPAFNSSQATPSGVALTSSAEIDLFAPSGIGSTGTEYFTESGWTTSPYNHALLLSNTTCSPATVGAGTNSTTNGTPVTATAVGSPSAGSCTITVGDGLSGNSTASLVVTYTTSSISASAKQRAGR